jgi:hypothetical protein
MNYLKNFSFIFLLMLQINCRNKVDVYDGFESKELSNIWTADRMVKDAFETQSTIVRNGHSAAKITLKTGDMLEQGNNGDHVSERDELAEAKDLWSIENKVYQYKFSLFLPDSFPVVPVRLVIAQWKQKCPGDSACSDDSPVMAIRYVAGRLYITSQIDTGKETIFQTTEEVRNRWLDFTFRVRFSRTATGEIDAWLNGKQIIHFRNITCYGSKTGYPDPSRFYFKTGLYRNVMAAPMTIYIDEYSKKELAESGM